MNRILLPILSIIVLVICNSCKKNIGEVEDQSKIYPCYYVNLSETDTLNHTTAAAQFFQGPARAVSLKLFDGSITFNNDVLQNDTTANTGQPFSYSVGTYYHNDFPGLIQGGRFEFKDARLDNYINITPQINAINSIDTSYTIQIGDTLTLPWQGLPVQPNEEVSLVGLNKISIGAKLVGEAATVENQTFISFTTDNTDTIFTVDTFYVPPIIPQELRFYRATRHRPSDNPNGEPDGGSMVVKYTGRPFVVHIVP